ncbi:unnamed protein product [Alopecurus aequalis]
MADGQRRRRRRKNAERRARLAAALAAQIDAVPEEVFELVFLRLPMPLQLVRAACTCKRWRRIIAADDGRLIRSLHGAPSSHVVGNYHVYQRWFGSRPPGRSPSFIHSYPTSPWTDIIAGRSLALDFLPRPEHSGFRWELADIRGGFLLVLLFSAMIDDGALASPLRILVCDPLARCYSEIPLPEWFHGCSCLGAFLRDGEDAGAPISLSNFRVTCALYQDCIARAGVFSSTAGGRWTSGAAARGNDCRVDNGADIRFAGCADDGSVAYWTVGCVAPILLILDTQAAELRSSFVADREKYAALRGKQHAPVYAYRLSWPPTIRACLS